MYNPNEWFQAFEAAALVAKSAAWLSINWRKFGLDRIRVGTSIMYRRDQIEALAEQLREQEAGR